MALSQYELMDLCDAVEARIADAIVPAIIRANRTDELNDLLELLGMADLVVQGSRRSRGKIIVLGKSEVKESKLRSIAKAHGISGDRIEFCLEYKRLEHYPFDRLRNNPAIEAVLAGPMPHSTPGKRNASSAITEMEDRPDIYPHVIQMEDAHGPKITCNSFAQALETLDAITYLMCGI